MAQTTLRIATRNSPLALWQANHIRTLLMQHWPKLKIELVPMLTSGDKFLKDKLLALGGKGLFVKELEEALLDGRADLAVHSMKDVPTTFPDGLTLSAICKRDSPFDVLVSSHFNHLAALPLHATIGTSSLRRQSQLLAHRPDLRILPLRGNIQTRLSKLLLGEFDAIILAKAGLERMQLGINIKETLDTEIMLPACGQGAIGIECRVNDEKLQPLIAPLNDALSALCVQSERHVNALLGGNCHIPLAVYCESLSATRIQIRAVVATPDGKIILRDRQMGAKSEALTLADQCAKTLLNKGAAKLLHVSNKL
jgi:hydroxymethylbilane synthase